MKTRKFPFMLVAAVLAMAGAAVCEEAQEDNKTLVAWFSVTGNTK